MSNVPPPFTGSEGYRKKSNTGLIIMVIVAVLVGGCILMVGAAAFFGMNLLNTGIKPMLGCQVSFETVRFAMREYAEEHQGKLPSAATWQDELRPYMEKAVNEAKKDMEGAEAMMRVMDVKGEKWGCYTGSGDEMTGMAFNSSVGGKKIDDVESKATTVLIFEVAKGEKNLNMPFTRQDPEKSPAIFGDHRGWFEVTWEETNMLSDGQRVNMSSSRRRRDRDRGNEDTGASGSSENSTTGAGDSSSSDK